MSLTLLLVGCGQVRPGSAQINGAAASSPSPLPSVVAGSSIDDFVSACSLTTAMAKAPVVLRADMVGDGRKTDVRMTAADGLECPSFLLAKLGSSLIGTPLDDVRLDKGGFRAVTLPGRSGQVLLARESEPRGMVQDHVFAYAAGRLGELLVDGHPPVPRMITDSASGYADVTCSPDGFTLTRAVPHSPAGAVFAWDIERTRYTLDGLRLSTSGPTKVEDNVRQGDLEKDYPALVSSSTFIQDC